MEINNENVCLVNRNGQPGTATCSSSSSRWWYGTNPSALSSTLGGYLTTGGYYTWLDSNQGDFSQWRRIY
ncbi:hypothetical protein [Kitasatospora purpeofusca]|uniref:hypothetical protein n=1 Tax=Kitasatospora purpeofusca TaxID=67352 RepID=UPI002A5A554F|nr:hypothetical protein [Kitasatospora purpeofusca]MDY0816794.1 hypothetical protein [Kitasatospora purpeofusca]